MFRMSGKVWIKQMIVSAFILPAVVCGTAFFINFIAIYYHASRAIPFGTMVAVTCICLFVILPLTLVGGEVSLGLAPTNSALPLSPIFIKTNSLNNNSNTLDNKFINISEYYNGNPAGLLDNLEEITSLPNDFLNIGEFCLPLSPSLSSLI